MMHQHCLQHTTGMGTSIVGRRAQGNLGRTHHRAGSWRAPTSSRGASLVPRGYRSFDETNPDSLDSSLASELRELVDPGKKELDRQRKHMELTWRVANMKRQKAETCNCCQGSAETECEWCHGTGVMMLGDTIYVNAQGTKPCPICKGKGYMKCNNCRGTGFRAVWLDEDADPRAHGSREGSNW
uniref:CR-type domain-containing protein n=1 Tax=Dunaliella tertiolecta TaxID=3047 RepID=A0A7S3RA86_DUNTE|mmetsp:Transcript_8055/g.21454  ORF Transcript_8055/g.21454 Transcript_8055/m.21454 type:complete len:184 (+) Transcript_8055:40-591(+)|eukprot:CAMPEP_0202378522 /NCGR_PEP_ID=MMETSP1127-20130417/19014_1 /ASSEMBLY_ACC=CAM_ASM_000462 /TAXON_ID=3047 /ORGANISM="Dunaliella tertiolecta, Strain CCMP1320" /LENGTH=183 /DNA_ID=CAMNT_0048976847 /DNA_START=17 /DNA_END=568 /DNA_ORIENTATION=-